MNKTELLLDHATRRLDYEVGRNKKLKREVIFYAVLFAVWMAIALLGKVIP